MSIRATAFGLLLAGIDLQQGCARRGTRGDALSALLRPRIFFLRPYKLHDFMLDS